MILLIQEVLIQLGVIGKDFPRVGSADKECAIEGEAALCDYLVRSTPPLHLKSLPFPPTMENVPQMCDWLIQR